jgi:RND family efflux transporter MFP subunit
VDKGDPVTQGQILAVIESPEIDRQYDAALADAKNKRAEAKRAWRLLPQGGASQQAAEAAEAAAQMAEAYTAVLQSQKDYEILRAPFRGTVSARYADPGALIQSATTAQTTALPLLGLSQSDRLRVYVYLDQKNAGLVQVGDSAEISDAARPETKLPATVSRTSRELDAKTRTLLTELEVANEAGRIVAGSFVNVALTLRNPPGVQIPGEALAIRGETTTVGVLNDQDRVNFRPVVIAESDGKVVNVSAGLTEGEKVILNPGKGIVEGDRVQPIDLTVP